jgi:undecaprenyl-diphosphatase
MSTRFMRRELSERAVLFLIAGTAMTLAAIFLKIADSVRENEVVVHTDRHVLDFVLRHRTAWLSDLARAVTMVGSVWVVAPLVVAAVAGLVVRRRRDDALFVALASLGAAILVAIVKHAVGRPRPAISDRLVSAAGGAFPSGHAAQSVACYFALAIVAAGLVQSRRARTFAYAGASAIAVAVGGSRVYLGVHWASDVVCGWLLAGGWLLVLVGARFAVASARAARSGRGLVD